MERFAGQCNPNIFASLNWNSLWLTAAERCSAFSGDGSQQQLIQKEIWVQ
jgi:hypothetical protein